MRRIVALFIAAMLVAGLTACGGGGEEAEAPPAEGEAAAPAAEGGAPPPAPGVPVAATSAVGDKSKVETDYPAPFPEVNESTPPEVADALKLKQPLLIVFVDKAQKTTDDVKAELNSVTKKYRGLIEVTTYDISAAVDAEQGSEEASASLEAALFAKDLSIGYAPYMIVVDRNGMITWRSSGYVDRGLIEREVLRATQ
jgi:hypothetical protein